MIACMTTPSAEERRRLGRHGRHAVPRSSAAAAARLRPRPAADPHRLRDLRDAVAGARQRHPRLPRAERRRARRRLLAGARRREHPGRLPRRRARRRQGPRPRLVGRHDRARQGLRHRSLLRRQLEPARRLPRHDRALVHEPRDRAARTAPTFRSSPSPTWCAPSARSSASSASRGWRRSPADRSAACRRSSGRCSSATRSAPSFRSRARTRSIRRASPGTRSRAAPSPPIRTGRAATTTAPAARRRRAWASRGWSDTSRICRPSSLNDKFGRRLQFADDIRYTLTEPEFEVESYLRHQADSFVKRFDANTYLYTSRALSYFDLARQYGGGQLAHAVRDMSRRGRCSSPSAPTGSIRRRDRRSWRPRCAPRARTSIST